MSLPKNRDPLACGYQVKISAELTELLKKYIPENDHDLLKEDVYVAIWFSTYHGDPPRGITEENCQEPIYVTNWFNKKSKQTEFSGILKSLYVKKNKELIVAVINCNGDLAYAFLYNKSKVATSVIKKAITAGHEGSHSIEQVPLSGKYHLTAIPYLHYIGLPTILAKVKSESIFQ